MYGQPVPVHQDDLRLVQDEVTESLVGVVDVGDAHGQLFTEAGRQDRVEVRLHFGVAWSYASCADKVRDGVLELGYANGDVFQGFDGIGAEMLISLHMISKRMPRPWSI